MSNAKRPYNPSHTPSPSESSRAPNVIRTSAYGRGLIERHEEVRDVSNRLYWPGDASGVTLESESHYDMRDRSWAEIEQKLRDISFNSSLMSRVAVGGSLRDKATMRFAHNKRNLVNLTDDWKKRALSTTKTSLQGSKFIERHEEQKGISNRLHWPGGASGVTLGPGYDMRDRSRAEIEQRLRDIGINASLASRVAVGAGLRGEAAKRFAKDNRNLVNLTDDQQRHLLQVNLPNYEAIVRRGSHVYLTQNEFDALVSFVYNPGRGWPGVRAAINSGDKRKAVKIIEKQVRSKGKVLRGLVKRRHDEAMLLLEGRY